MPIPPILRPTPWMPVLALAWSATMWLSAPEVRGEDRADYLGKVKPVLKEHCYSCHGALKQAGGLRLDTGRALRRGGDSGPAVVPGRPEESPLIERVAETDADARMPFEAPALAPSKVAALRDWVAAGAPSPEGEEPERSPKDHWSFRPLVRPSVPRTIGGAWAINPIDHFVAAGHERRGLSPRPPTDRATLLRRVSLDLIGLPPTRDELHAFLADEGVDAYERVVDRLLASPRYGERWGRHWMDVWRYSDWYGRRMVPDVWNSAPQIWRWRDWIVRSLNEDKGYDRMVQEMLAADEIAPGDDEAAVATGYLVRNWYALNPNQWMRDNVEHTAKAFLGLTFNCAHCHDHKYDPIRQDDYFRFRAFFEPIGMRQDRVAGEADPGPFQKYEYSKLRKIVRAGSVRDLRQEARGADLVLHRRRRAEPASRQAGRSRRASPPSSGSRRRSARSTCPRPRATPACGRRSSRMRSDPVARRFIGRIRAGPGPRGGHRTPSEPARNWPRGGGLTSRRRSGGGRQDRRPVGAAVSPPRRDRRPVDSRRLADGPPGGRGARAAPEARRGAAGRGAVPPGERGGPSRRRPGEVRPGAVTRRDRVGRGREPGRASGRPRRRRGGASGQPSRPDRSRGEAAHRRDPRGRGRQGGRAAAVGRDRARDRRGGPPRPDRRRPSTRPSARSTPRRAPAAARRWPAGSPAATIR